MLRKASGAVNTTLEIFLDRNQLQLATTDALYSDGDRYLPAITALDQLKAFLPSVSNVLVLGTGLGSMVRAMRSKGYNPNFTLVDNDEVVLKWAIEFLDDANISRITPVCMDANAFIEQNNIKYDLIFIDIFSGRVVPGFVTTAVFLQQCRDSLAPGGHLAFNYIINDDRHWESVQNICSLIFPGYTAISMGINRIIIS